MTVTTNSGFACEVDESALDDMECVELVGRIDKGDTLAAPLFLAQLIGEEQKKTLYDHVRNEKGRVPIGAVMDELWDILDGVGGKK